MLAGIMHYKQGASSPYHLHENCEHFYFIMEGDGTAETEEGVRKVGPGDLVFIPAASIACAPPNRRSFITSNFRAPNRFVTTILDGTPEDLVWNRSIEGGKVWVQT